MTTDWGRSSGQQILITLYEQYGAWLKARAFRILRDTDICEDILQDCMLKAIQHLELIESLEENQRKKYLAVTVDNLARNYASRIRYDYVLFDSLPEELLISNENIEIAVEEKIEYEIILKTLNALSEHDRKIIIMKYKMRMRDCEIASVFDIKENSVRMTVRRSVFNLKKKIGVVKNYETIA